MTTSKVQMVEIEAARIHSAFDVRDAPMSDEAVRRVADKALNFAENMEAGQAFPCPVVTMAKEFPGNMFSEIPGKDYIIVDGRTRIRAIAEVLEKKSVICEVKRFKTVFELEAFAYRSNSGGPEPMTREETQRIVLRLSSQNLKAPQIHELIQLPLARVEAIISGVRSAKLMNRVVQAGLAVKSGKPVAQAAKDFEVELNQLKKHLEKHSESRRLINLSSLKAAATTAAKKYIQSIQKICSGAYDAYGTDTLSSEHLSQLLNHLDKLGMDIQRANTERRRSAEKVVKSEKGTIVMI